MDISDAGNGTLDGIFPVDAESCREHFEGFFEYTTAVMQTPEVLTGQVVLVDRQAGAAPLQLPPWRQFCR